MDLCRYNNTTVAYFAFYHISKFSPHHRSKIKQHGYWFGGGGGGQFIFYGGSKHPKSRFFYALWLCVSKIVFVPLNMLDDCVWAR